MFRASDRLLPEVRAELARIAGSAFHAPLPPAEGWEDDNHEPFPLVRRARLSAEAALR